MTLVSLLLLITVLSIPASLSSNCERLEETEKELDDCLTKLNDQSYLGSVCSKVGSWLSKDTSMKSSVVKFLNKFELLSPGQSSAGIERDVTIQLSSEDIKILKQFALQGEGSPETIENVLLDSMKVKETILDKTSDFFSHTMTETSMHFKANYVIIFQVTVLVLFVVLPLSLGSPKRPVFMLMCLYAVFTSWVKLYYIASAKKQATLAKLSNIPNSCLLERQGWLAAAGDFVSGLFNGRQDPCEDYYTAALVDPAWEVGLVDAVMETVSVCVIVPAETIGTALGSYYTCLLHPLPWAWKLPVLLMATLTSVLLLLVMCGYEFSIPFMLRIGPNKSIGTLSQDNGSLTNQRQASSPGGFVNQINLDRHPSQECDMTDNRAVPYPIHASPLDHIVDQATNFSKGCD